MATYKLIQDIEAEDHILGPLTLRQFIFALMAVFFYYISFILLTKGAAWLLIAFLPPALFFTFFAIPFGRDQPTEIWALAKLRFYLKPRRRIWDQSGVKELVTITVPKKIEIARTDGLSQTEVRSRLQALANTIDSRGWAVKNVNVNAFSMPNPLMTASSDRLIDVANMPQEVPNYDVQAADDILDEASNPIAAQFDHMINESAQAHRQQVIQQMNHPTPQSPTPNSQPADYWFMNQTAQPTAGQSMFSGPQLVQPITAGQAAPIVGAQKVSQDEAALTAQLKRRKGNGLANAHLRTLQPTGGPAVADNNSAPTTGAVAPDPAILSLASNNDLNVATLAREAHKAKGGDEPLQDEVVISLR